MHTAEDGWWAVDISPAAPGTDYAFLLGDDDTPLPDPRSLRQKHGVHGLSQTYDHRLYAWHDAGWTGRQLPGSIIYELHIGTFTPEGTFAAAIDRLDELIDLGIDMVELLPINSFAGVHNWGYDGVCWYAVHEPYGGPDDLKAFVDDCHQRGVGVLIDVVYNHLGPSGAYLPRFGPYFNDNRNTWGHTPNLDGPDAENVRRYILDNALMWLTDFHADGLRLDAVHALADRSAVHILEQMATEVDALSTHLRRPLTLLAESDLNDPRLITSRDGNGYGLSAQWNDDVHHALHVLLTRETQGYYVDFADPSALAKTFRGGFFHDGTWSSFRRRNHGRPIDKTRIPGHRFVACLQDHDQIGNRAGGDRLTKLLSPGLLKVGAALLLTGPFTPMLFMGEEWGSSKPWQYFTDFQEPELAARVGIGRREEFAQHGWSGDVPDPQDRATFLRSKLDWSERAGTEQQEMLRFYRELIALRRRFPELSDPRLDRIRVSQSERLGEYVVVHRGRLVIACNLSPERLVLQVNARAATLVLASTTNIVVRDDQIDLPAESVAILLSAPDGSDLTSAPTSS